MASSSQSRRGISFVLVCIISLIGYGFFVFAAPPGPGGYTPGETLDPECNPGDLVPEPCIVQLGIHIGDEIINGTATQMLYTDNAGNLFSDSNFTRDSITQETSIGTPIAATYNEPNSQFFIIADTTGNTGNVITITFDGVIDVDTAVANWNSANPSNTATVLSGGTYTPSAGSISLSGGAISKIINGSLANGAVHGSGFQSIDTTNNIITGIMSGNISGFGSGSHGNAILTQDNNNGYISALIQGPQSQQFIVGDISSFSYFSQFRQDSTTTALSFSDTSNDSSLILDTNGLNYITNGVTYFLPNGALPNINDVMTVVSTSGSAAYLGFVPAGGSSGWSLTGNSGTTAGTNFLGTTDSEDLIFKTNNQQTGFISDDGYSIGFGASAGDNASRNQTLYLGLLAGQNATGATGSTFIGGAAGRNATNATGAVFIGNSAGEGATRADFSLFFGSYAGQDATDAEESVFIGVAAGDTATNAYFSNFMGDSAGYHATDASFSNFFGNSAGRNAASANNSNFFGQNTGYDAVNASYSNFFGYNAGYNATDALNSNFLGTSAGLGANNASYSNFIGSGAGRGASNGFQSNFFGENAGRDASDASNSTFIGRNVGYGAINASNSIFIGQVAGFSDTVDNTTDPDDFSILIGSNTSTAGFENSIAIGGSATNTASNQFMIGSATRPIDEIVMVSTGGTTCATDINGTACSSDERLKTNITNLANTTLDTLLHVKTVTFNWNNNTDTASHIGFIAQDIQQYFPELVSTGSTGFLSVNYAGMAPVLVEAIREMNLNMTQIADMTQENTWRDSLIEWFESTTNGIRSLVVKDKICVDDQCLTKDDIQVLLQMKNQQNFISTPPSPVISDTPVISEPDPESPEPSDGVGDTPPDQDLSATDSVPIAPPDISITE